MIHSVSFQTRTLLVQSIHAVEARRDEVQAALSISLARSEQDPELSETPELVAALLVNFLIEQVHHLIEDGAPKALELHRIEHRLNGIDGRHYSRFGDALVPVLRDSLDPSFGRATAAAWCDAFWAIVRHLPRGDEAAAPRKAPLVAQALA